VTGKRRIAVGGWRRGQVGWRRGRGGLRCEAGGGGGAVRGGAARDWAVRGARQSVKRREAGRLAPGAGRLVY
jgi:hypothetical protein